MAKVELKGVVKQYGATQVVHGANLSVNDNEFLVMVGPSGCGKSTILRMIAGLESISSGEIRINGTAVNNVAPKDRNVAMVFQNYALYPHMTVYNNMAFGLKMAKISKADIDAKVQKAAKILELTPYLSRKPSELSGGQRQRVAMGRAIVRKPAVFLFDEPLSNLDAQLRTQMRMELKKLHRQMQTTTVYVTHDQVEAMTLADRIVILKDGNIQQVGTPIEVFERPVNRFVAGFIGNPPINVSPGIIGVENGRTRVTFGALELPVPRNPGLGNDTKIEVGIRPDSIKVAAPGIGQADESIIRGQVEVCEIVGGQSLLQFTAGGVTMIAELEGRMQVPIGQSLDLAVDLDRLLFFDPDTEQAIYL